MYIESDVPDLTAVSFNDIASSLKLGGSYWALLYDGPNYTGAYTIIHDSQPRLDTLPMGDHKITSMKLNGNTADQCGGGSSAVVPEAITGNPASASWAV